MTRLPEVTVTIALAIAAGYAQAAVFIAPQQITLAAPAGSNTAAVQTLEVSSAPDNQDYTAEVRYLSGVSGWLSVSPASGKTAATLTVTANAGKLPAGTYLAQIVVAAGSLGTAANVVFTVGSSSGAIIANPTALTFFDQSYAPAFLTQTVQLAPADPAAATLAYTASATSVGNWLSVSPFPSPAPGSLQVMASTTGLMAGVYSGTVTIIPAAGLPTVVPVTLSTAGPAQAPVTLALSQTKVSFNYQTRTPPDSALPAPPPQTVDVTAGPNGASFTATASDSWIQLTSPLTPLGSTTATGTAPGPFFVAMNPTGLAQGVHAGSVTLRSPGLPDRQLAVEATVGPGVALNANPSSVVMNNADSQTVAIASTNSANVAFTVAALPGAPWLHTGPSNGSTVGAATVTISSDTTGLAAGVYSGTVAILPTSGTGGLSIPVQLQVTGPTTGPGALLPSMSAVAFDSVAGADVPAQTISLDSQVQGAAHPFTAAASSDGGWLAVDPFQGTAPATLNVRVNPGATAHAGSYSGQITLTSLTDGSQTIIGATLSVNARGIAADRNSLTFTCPELGVAPPPQSLAITANTPSTFGVVAPSWLRVTPASGATPATLSVAVDPTGLAPGITSGLLRIVGPDNLLSIPVSVTMPGPPSIIVSNTDLAFSHTLGNPSPTPVNVSLGSSNGHPLSFSAVATTSDGGAWLSVAPASGIAPASVAVSVDPSKLPAGSYSGSIMVSGASGDVQAIAVELQVGGTPSVQLLLHGATLAPTPISPGLVVAITGTGLGPAVGTGAQLTSAGKVDTRLSETRVLFDGIQAPLLFVRSDQVNAIVPYAMYGRASTRIEVETPAGTSTPIDARVVDAAPGVFTADSSGSGQAAALNGDMTANSSSNPAKRGDVVVIFGTGEGQTDPQGDDGRVIADDIRYPLLPVTATVGGKPAEVVYLGSAPSLVSGVFQANIRIPADVEPGAALVRIEIGPAKTQSSVSVFVQ